MPDSVPAWVPLAEALYLFCSPETRAMMGAADAVLPALETAARRSGETRLDGMAGGRGAPHRARLFEAKQAREAINRRAVREIVALLASEQPGGLMADARDSCNLNQWIDAPWPASAWLQPGLSIVDWDKGIVRAAGCGLAQWHGMRVRERVEASTSAPPASVDVETPKSFFRNEMTEEQVVDAIVAKARAGAVLKVDQACAIMLELRSSLSADRAKRTLWPLVRVRIDAEGLPRRMRGGAEGPRSLAPKRP